MWNDTVLVEVGPETQTMHACVEPLLHKFHLDARKGLASSFEKDVYIAMRKPGGVNYLLDKLCLSAVFCVCAMCM